MRMEISFLSATSQCSVLTEGHTVWLTEQTHGKTLHVALETLAHFNDS